MVSSSSPSAPDFSYQPWKYHVFLSFRGEDTRKTFVDHLYSALQQQGIHTYKDDQTLPRGASIGPSLMKAIEESQIAVVIFSENYADSSWCLDELACIMKCKDAKGQIVLPIFYGVDPSEVRKQKRKYGEAFARHELENKKHVESWRKALVHASNLSGWELKHIANGHESKGIKQIVVEISHKLAKLQPVTLSANENLIGMASRMKCLKSELEIGSGGVRMIGIWGVGGGGKTTLASSIYEEISYKFDGCCFVDNIREESSRYGLGKLQEKILSEMDVQKIGQSSCLINNRLRHRKVLVVLDDVDHLDQLKALAGSRDWFGDGSRIIVTTRDEHILIVHKVDVIHNISLLNDDEAMKLFIKHAPCDNRPMKDYMQLTKEVVSYAGGLPLALTVLGSFLCDKDINEWKSALMRLKEIPETDILEKLKISYDGLKLVEKDLFLDIACFFRRKSKKLAMEILEDCGFYPVIGVKVLIQKALITISDRGRFDMHDLVQEMGYHIVRGKNPKNLEKHSRVWKREDFLKICAMDATTDVDMIEAIRFEYKRYPLLQHLPPIVANTKNLRWIEWEGDLASPLLTNFPQRTLCRLVLSNSLQKQLWEGYKLLPNLKTIELWELENLIKTPDLGGLPNLETFKLAGCSYLEEIHSSIGCLERLHFLFIGSCGRLEMFPSITRLKKLKTLTFIDCPQLFKLSKIQQNMEILPHLDLDKSGKEVASYIECCLEGPSLSRYMKPCLRDDINHIGLRFFLKDLRNLNLGYCDLGDEEIGSAVWELPNLQELDLTVNDFSRLTFSRLQLPRLKFLNVSDCKRLVKLSELPSSIAVVIADGCTSLESFGDVSDCKWLWNVSLEGKNKLGDGDILLDSMVQGNAIEDHFINIRLQHQYPKGFVGRMFRGTTYKQRLSDDWYNNFCGLLICIVTQENDPHINIDIKQEVDEDPLCEGRQESNVAVEPELDRAYTFVGYVSLRNTTFWSSSYTSISVKLDKGRSYVGVELVRRKSKSYRPQTKNLPTTHSEQFWDEGVDYRPQFTIQHGSESSVNFLWRP